MVTEFIELQRAIRRLHDENGLTFRRMADLPDFRKISFSMLNAIYNGREPKDPIIRELLGLSEHVTCGMCHTFNKYIRTATRKPKRWRDMPIKTLKAALLNREEIN